MNKQAKQFLRNIERRNLTNNTQKVLFDLLNSDREWTPRSQIKVPSVGSRLRDLRKSEFGSFKVSVRRVSQMEEVPRKTQTTETFYRIEPSTLTAKRIQTVFEGVISSK